MKALELSPRSSRALELIEGSGALPGHEGPEARSSQGFKNKVYLFFSGLLITLFNNSIMHFPHILVS